MNKTKTTDISNYDLYKYDYENYWKQGRAYEDLADRKAISSLLYQSTGDWFIDIGGSYGRLTDLYRHKFLHNVIIDYSFDTLLRARRKFRDAKITNINLVAANVYSMPFRDEVFSGGQMIRVMHHLEKPETALSEISRIMRKRSDFILEFANKIHTLAKIKFFLSGKWKTLFSKDPYRQPVRKTKQGVAGADGIFLNFHPGAISNFAKDSGFIIKTKLSVSNLRMPLIKRIIPMKLLSALEGFLQKPFALINFGPSIYFLLAKREKLQGIQTYKSVFEIICCPKCKGELNKKSSNLICKKCNLQFPIENDVIDLRWPRP